jgi:hypothetical protein
VPDANTAATGSWNVTVTLDGQDYPMTLALRQEGARLTGSISGTLGAREIGSGSIGADGFRFTASITLKEGSEEATFAGTIDGNALSGRMSIVGHTPGTFTGTRPRSGGLD